MIALIIIVVSIILLIIFIPRSRKQKSGANPTKSYSNLLKDTFSTSFDTSATKKKLDKHQAKQKSVASISIADNQNIEWGSEFFGLPKDSFRNYLNNIPNQYREFKLRKRKGGFRTISAPNESLQSIQRTINEKILSLANVHEAAKGYRLNMSVVDNAKPHLGNVSVLKIDLVDFFGSIRKDRVVKLFKSMGYTRDIAQMLGDLCTLKTRLPQGAPTSPAISNIISYNMDIALEELASKNNLIYSRYADDLTFSGDIIPSSFYTKVERIVKKERFAIQKNKTRFLTPQCRKIITGVSISSGQKMTIPKAKKREIRKNVHFITTKGLEEHQRFIKSSDPVYLKRLIGNLHFWYMIEPENEFVKKSLAQLKQIAN